MRPVDHFSWSAPAEGDRKRVGKRKMTENSVNGHTVLPEKLAYDHIDDLVFIAPQFILHMKVALPSC